jgi:hypothetical protein
MNIETKIKNNPYVAVFARNHRKYLDSAVRRNVDQPERFTTFRASTLWKSAHYANKLHGTLDVYFAPIGGEKLVQYRAMLHRVKIYPKRGDSDTETILGFELDETKGEGLWEKDRKRVDTLYVITHCVKLSKPFPMTRLVKVSDDEPISEKYGYSYCLVYTHLGDSAEDLEIFPEEIKEPKKYFEGASKTISVNTYERSKVARMRCVEHHGVDCSVCGFNFENIYGEIGEGFIHVHHLKPLVEIDEKYEVDPIKDLIPICPNCHAMLHKKIPVYSIKKLRSIIRPSKKKD